MRAAAARDWGGHLNRLPDAVLHPGSAADLRRIVQYANELGLKVAPREGGKIYPPFAPPLSRDEWRQHCGPATWKRLLAAKRRFDPSNMLTPGAGLVPQRSDVPR